MPNALQTTRFQYRHIPARRPGPEEKLLVVFHGLGDSLEGYAWMPRELGLDGLAYFLVNAPDDYYGGYSWFDFMGDPAPGIRRSRALIAELLEELGGQGVKPGNLMLFGFSQGGLMALDTGLRTDKLLGGICAVSGRLAFREEYPGAFSPVALQQRFLVTHGLRDPILPYAASKSQCEYLVSLGVDLDFRTYDKDHTILPGELRDIREWLQGRMGD